MSPRDKIASLFASVPPVLRQSGESAFGVLCVLIGDYGRKSKAAPEFVESLQSSLVALAERICQPWPTELLEATTPPVELLEATTPPVELLEATTPPVPVPNDLAQPSENTQPTGDSSPADAGSAGQ